MGTDQVGLLKVVSGLSGMTLALLLLGGVLYLQVQERRFEAERADRDRDVVTELLRTSVQEAKADRAVMKERGELFLNNQAQFISQQERIVDAIEQQAILLRQLKGLQENNTQEVRQTLRRETQTLIEALGDSK